MSLLIACASCRRHLRRTESVCPFCAAPVPAAFVEPRPVRSLDTKRAVLFAMSVAASACEADTNTIAIYGAPVAPEGGRGGTAGTSGSGGHAGVSGAGGNSGVAGRGGSPAVTDDGGAGAPNNEAGVVNDAGDGAADDNDAGDNDAGD